MSGFILTHRSILDNWIWGKEKKSFFEAWMYILLKANYEDAKVRVGFELIDVKRGEFFTSQEQLGLAFRWDRNTVRKFLNLLEKDEMLKIETSTRFTKLTICKYDSYQENKKTEFPEKSKKSKKDAKSHQGNELIINEFHEDFTNDEPTEDQRRYTTKQELINTNQLILLVVEYLNEKTGKNFKTTTGKTSAVIKARLNEKYTIEDFKKVIDCKVSKWTNDEKMRDYLRPETLFGTKFDSYLNECATPVITPAKYVDHHEYIFGAAAK